MQGRRLNALERRRAGTLVLWAGGTIAIAAACFALRVVIDQTPYAAKWWMSTNWLALYFTAPIPFGILIWGYRPCWRRREFWGTLSALSMAHLAVHAAFLCSSTVGGSSGPCSC